MKALNFFVELLDNFIFKFLMKVSEEIFPQRWKKFFAMYFPDARVRKKYWASFDVFMGENTYSNPGFTVVKNNNDTSRIIIGNNVSIGPNVIIVTDSAPNNSKLLRNITYVKNNLVRESPVRIEDDAWLGAGVIILPGVIVGKGAIVGAGSVVREDVAPLTVVAGAPAKLVRVLNNEESFS